MLKLRMSPVFIIFIIFSQLFICNSVFGVPTDNRAERKKTKVLLEAIQVEGEEAEKNKISEEEIQEAETPEDKVKRERKHIVTTLESMIHDINILKQRLSDSEKEFKAAEQESEKAAIKEETERLNEHLKSLRTNFGKVIAGINLSAFEQKSETAFKWEEEVSDLLQPVIQELKSMTSRPRQIQKLRSDIAHYENTLPIAKKIIKNIQLIKRETEDEYLIKELKEMEADWRDKEHQIANQLIANRLQLEELTKDEKPLLDSAQGALKNFFKTRGKNILLSFIAFFTVFVVFRLTHQGIYKLKPVKERTFYIRLFDVIYYFVGTAGALFASLAVLYVFGDWVLLTLILIFTIGFLWTAKENIPRFWNQIKLLLNLGPVRENERLIYGGVPWKVTCLNFYTDLENPLLKSQIKLPLHKLTEMVSYPCHKDERWFPCKEGDWVVLSDGTRAQMRTQTHETVRLVLLSGANKSYLTEDFLRLNPLNISENFRLKVTFGVSYDHLFIITDELPETMKKTMEESFRKENYGNYMTDLTVDFKETTPSALELEISAYFSGEVAPLYEKIQKDIYKFCVHACKQNAWNLPHAKIAIRESGEDEDEME
ncbi:hypothetical protein [Desulfonema magnum]|uniref:Uncharacterized protein n=1 Tax=Desulfonema magnum TaxID=45655 RepID=A0A975BPS0_9BACT|nr:hypothetical protein [Desulfonema magnum]QTA89393.1 Uncharacterized protein dnm_054440 [Desulfonema magnum]